MVDHRDDGQPLSWRDLALVFRVIASIRFFVVFAVRSFPPPRCTSPPPTQVARSSGARSPGGEATVDGIKHLQVSFIALTDDYLLGTVLIVVAMRLSQLYIQADHPLPQWLRVRRLNQLSAQLIEVVAVRFSVACLGVAIEAGTWADFLRVGIRFARVIAALSVLLVVVHRLHEGSDPPYDQ